MASHAVVDDRATTAAVDLLSRLGVDDAASLDQRALVVGLAGVAATVMSLADRRVVDGSTAAELIRHGGALHHILNDRRLASDAARPSTETRVASAIEAAARDLCTSYGFERVMGFTVGSTTLDPVITTFAQDDGWASELHDQAEAAPPRLDLFVREAEAVDGQQPILIERPQVDPRTWKPIVAPARTISYVVAPVVVSGTTIATLHADCWFSSREMTDTDRFVIGLFADEVGRRISASSTASGSDLTPHQVVVLEMVAAGKSNGSIARELGISPETIKSHLTNIYRRLGVSTRTEAVTRFYGVDRS